MIKTYDIQNISEVDTSVLNYLKEKKHEKVVYCVDPDSNLKAIIAIHNTNLGPALGGTRIWNYNNINEAANDVLRLSRGMTYKAAITGLKLGGGKAVIIGHEKNKNNEMMYAFGQFVESLKGKYITAEDVGMTPQDMRMIYEKTNHVVGKPKDLGGSGDPSVITAYGVYMGMKGSAKFKWGNDSLENKKILVQGTGHVGENLIKLLEKENANIIVHDINHDKLNEIKNNYHVSIITENIYNQEIDIYAPCALGATLNDLTINQLKCSIIAGAANNQLENEKKHDNMIKSKGILYAPDFLINAGGLINVYSELKGFSHNEVIQKTENIYDTTIAILKKSKEENIPSQQAAMSIAKEKVHIKLTS